MDPLSQRQLKEQFVSNLNGTSVAEVALWLSSAPLSALVNVVFCQVLVGHSCIPQWLNFLVDFTTLIIPGVLLATVLSEHIDVTYFVLTLLVVALLAFHSSKASYDESSGLRLNSVLNFVVTGKRPFITNFRACVLVGTAIMILAVDFNAFPRRFGKAETFGTGLMDAGVGSFVISNAIVSPEARRKYPVHRGIRQRIFAVVRAAKSCIPLLVLGVARTVSVKATDYQQHVSEYGVHWNFFFTLAAVKILSTVILCLWDPSWSWLISIAVASGYQYLLNARGLKRYILHGPDGFGSRSDFISANREGICSCLGYVSIYFAGVQLGQLLFQHRVKMKEWIRTWVTLAVSSALFWCLLVYAERNVEPVSRRMANLPFVLWMVFQNLQLLAAFLFVDLLTVALTEYGFCTVSDRNQRKRRSTQAQLLDAVNRNGLFFFLLANLLTGLVNFSMNTMEASLVVTVIVLLGYMFVLSVAAAALHVWNVTLRVW